MDDFAFAYLDDIIILRKTFNQHLEDLRHVFQRFRAVALRMKPEKFQFGRRSLGNLGDPVISKGIQIDPDKVEAIKTNPVPTNIRELGRCVGIASWYQRRKFFEDLSFFTPTAGKDI